jgi:hypothetical protein
MPVILKLVFRGGGMVRPRMPLVVKKTPSRTVAWKWAHSPCHVVAQRRLNRDRRPATWWPGVALRLRVVVEGENQEC